MSEDAATRPPIRVLVIDDSAFMRTALSRMIASESGFEVAATACSGSDALDRYFREQASQDIKRRVATCFIRNAAREVVHS